MKNELGYIVIMSTRFTWLMESKLDVRLIVAIFVRAASSATSSENSCALVKS